MPPLLLLPASLTVAAAQVWFERQDAALQDQVRSGCWHAVLVAELPGRERSLPRPSQVRGLVASGQLVFANGGWSMHDEAAPTFVDM